MSNISTSVRARLANLGKASGRPFQEVMQFYGLERYLYRLSQTPYARQFVLKGALMLKVWGAPRSRPTRDIDLLGFLKNDIETIEEVARAICEVQVQDDGLRFDSATVAGVRIKEDADYEGVRVTFVGFLQKSRIPMQIDVGFGDVVYPSPGEQDYPALLDFPAPRLRTYPRETVVAEKFEALVALGTLNSRLKDFYDLWLLSQSYNFNGTELATAIRNTFKHRGTDITATPIALTSEFMASDRVQKQWAAFLRRSNLAGVYENFADLREPLRSFLLAPSIAISRNEPFPYTWSASGPWRPL